MLIAPWIFVTIFGVCTLICLVALVGWIFEGERLSKATEEINVLRKENKRLAERLAHRNALDNIKVADDYAKEN
jgi:Tfp pilus assembly protein PilN